MYAVQMLFDISRTIGLDTVSLPNDPEPSLVTSSSLAEGAECSFTELHMHAHCGTHLDAPAHFIPGGETIDHVPLGRFFVRAQVVDTGDIRRIGARVVADAPFKPSQAVLFKTANKNLPRQAYSAEHVDLGLDAAHALIERGAGLIGIDYLSVERLGGHGYPVHRALLAAGILILEDIDLSVVRPGRYLLMCFPLRLHDAEAAPCRAVLESLRSG